MKFGADLQQKEAMKITNRNDEQEKAFNDAMEHLNKIEGFPISKEGNLPLPIKVIGYFMFGGIILMLLLGALISIFS